MDMRFTTEELAFRDEVRGFLADALTEDLRRGARLTSGVFAEADLATAWQRKLHARGWGAPHWPAAVGGPGWSPIQRYIFDAECAMAGAPVLPGMSLKLVGPVIYTYGTEAQKNDYLSRIVSGEDFWAQGFSEPNAGSDLASLRTRAVRQGEVYRVNGAKIWTTHAHFANKLFCLVRTDPDVKPQRGISFLLMDMQAGGVTVRPIISASGDHEVNEVFLDDVEVPVANRVGEEGQGWEIAKFLLENERSGSCHAPGLLADVAHMRRLLDADAGLVGADEAGFQERLEHAAIAAEALEVTELRILANSAVGRSPGHLGLMTKLVASEIHQQLDALRMELFGPLGLQLPPSRPFYAADAEAPVHSVDAQIAAARYLNGRAWSIFGGTSEIQLNIIAKAALGL